MRTGSLRSERAPFGQLAEISTSPKPRRRLRAPERPEVVAVHADDDWFALFANEDEKDGAPLEAAPLSRECAKGESPKVPLARRESAGTVAPEPVPAIQAPEVPRMYPVVSPSFRFAWHQWRFGPWRGIAGAVGIVLSAGVLVLAARGLAGDGTPAPADIEIGSAPSPRQSSWAPVSVPAAPASTSGIAAVTAPRTPAPATATPLVRSTTQKERSGTVSPRAAAPPRPLQPKIGPRATTTAPVSAKPTATPAPNRTAAAPTSAPIPTPIPTPIAAPASGLSGDAIAGRVSPPPPAVPARPSDSVLIRSLLDLYRQGYSSLDADAVAGVWPSVNTRSLARAFGQLESQRFEFTDCRIDLSSERAQATCTGRASYVPKIGGKTPRTENREWAFVLERLNDGWIISRAETR